jgi:hypothetical protein
MRVIKKHLENCGGEVLTRYVKPLTKEHFLSFLDRLSKFVEFRDAIKVEDHDSKRPRSEKTIEQLFAELAGPHVLSGPDANWIPIGAVIVIDEAHKWFDQRFQREENPALLAYTTMHRHMLHLIQLLSQDRMQISLSWRRQCVEYIRCVDKRRVGGLPFGLQLPIPAFFYERWPAEVNADSPGAKPLATFLKVPAFSRGLTWRFYQSFTHAGSVRKLKKELERTRAEIEGREVQEDRQNEDDEMKKKPSLKGRVVRWGVVAALVAVGYYVGRGKSVAVAAEPPLRLSPAPAASAVPPGVQNIAGRGAAASRPSSVPGDYPPASAFAPPPAPPPSNVVAAGDGVGVVADKFCVITGKIYAIGEIYGSWQLQRCDVAIGVTEWQDVSTGRMVLWSIGHAPVVMSRVFDAPTSAPARIGGGAPSVDRQPTSAPAAAADPRGVSSTPAGRYFASHNVPIVGPINVQPKRAGNAG